MTEMTEPQPPVTPPPVPPSPAAKSTRGLRIALGLSVALNLLVLGIVAGAVLRDGGPRDRMVRDLDFGPFTEALSATDRDALREEFVARMPALRDTRRAIREDFNALLAVLRADPYDAEAARQVLQAHRDRMEERIDLGQDLMLQRLAAMTPEARANFADRLERRLRRGPLDAGRDGKGEGGQGRD